MKKATALVLVLLAVVFACVGCGKESGNADAVTDDTYYVMDLYRKPADVVRIDLAKDDPSTDEMQFSFDEQGRVTECRYAIDGEPVVVTVDYEDGLAQIYAFMGSIVVADDQVALSAFDAAKGFAAIDGYYFKGYTAA